jgi:hypothetical protein
LRVNVTVSTVLPDVPLIVTIAGESVAGAVVVAVKDAVEEPLPVTEVGLKDAVTPAGNPEALKVTMPPKLPDGVTVIELVSVKRFGTIMLGVEVLRL